jgi:hypothetical protein
MDYEKKQDVALLRYTAIAPVVTGLGDAYGSNNDYTVRFLKKVSPARTGRSTISTRTLSRGGILPIKSRASKP